MLKKERDEAEARVKDLKEALGIQEKAKDPNAPFPVWGDGETQWLGNNRVRLMSDGTFVPVIAPEFESLKDAEGVRVGCEQGFVGSPLIAAERKRGGR